ncbi:hypothetical protein [Streptomyces tanashiensis]|uniref:hypothetical protein n=1 Tax=Streptomyces tanashiensis TaxID=67367 RepID=UPI0033C12241
MARTSRPRHCNYCPRPGADTCVRAQTAAEGGAHIYAHRECAQARGVQTIYAFVGPTTRGGGA